MTDTAAGALERLTQIADDRSGTCATVQLDDLRSLLRQFRAASERPRSLKLIELPGGEHVVREQVLAVLRGSFDQQSQEFRAALLLGGGTRLETRHFIPDVIEALEERPKPWEGPDGR